MRARSAKTPAAVVEAMSVFAACAVHHFAGIVSVAAIQGAYSQDLTWSLAESSYPQLSSLLLVGSDSRSSLGIASSVNVANVL